MVEPCYRCTARDSQGHDRDRGSHGRIGDSVHGGTADKIWNLIADIHNTGKFSPEVWKRSGSAAERTSLGDRFRGHVKRNEIGPVYWTSCEVTSCEPGREFGFAVLPGDKAVNNWHYRLTPVDGGTDVTESFGSTTRSP